MKARVSKFGHLSLTLAFCLIISACNKDDFYEKEFLEDPNQISATTGTVEGGDQGGFDTGTGGTQGGVDSGVDGGTDGSTTGGSTSAGGVDGSGTTGGTDGSTTGGVDGSTTTGGTDGTVAGGTAGGSVTGGVDGSTTGGTDGTVAGGTAGGSTTGGVDGSTTGGTDGSSTTGGVDGSTTGGSTTGGTTTGGTTTGGTAVEENFNQAASATKKLDILWIIDNSGSMADEQDELGTNFNAFIEDFITKDVDFKMAITTTDTRGSNKGKMVNGSDDKLTSAKAHADPDLFKRDFKRLIKVGTNGSGDEEGLAASEGFMSRYSNSFVRQDAYLAVVIVSDEEDQSPKTPTQYTDILKTYKSQAGLIKVYSIVDTENTNYGPGITVGHLRYKQASTNTAGVVANIRDDFYQVLNDMGDSIINLLDSFALANDPISGSLKVYVNGQETTEYSFDSASRSIKFNTGHVPPVNAAIKVTYRKL